MFSFNYGNAVEKHILERPRVIVSNPQAIKRSIDDLEIVKPVAATHIALPTAQAAVDLEL